MTVFSTIRPVSAVNEEASFSTEKSAFVDLSRPVGLKQNREYYERFRAILTTLLF